MTEEQMRELISNQQEEINLMNDGTEKKKAQIEHDYQVQIDEVKKQKIIGHKLYLKLRSKGVVKFSAPIFIRPATTLC